MAKSKFIQISTSSVIDHEDVFDSVHALDDKGVVWFFNAEDERWEALSTDRYEASGAAAEDESDEG